MRIMPITPIFVVMGQNWVRTWPYILQKCRFFIKNIFKNAFLCDLLFKNMRFYVILFLRTCPILLHYLLRDVHKCGLYFLHRIFSHGTMAPPPCTHILGHALDGTTMFFKLSSQRLRDSVLYTIWIFWAPAHLNLRKPRFFY